MKRILLAILLILLFALSACTVPTPDQSVAPQEQESVPASEPVADSSEEPSEPVESSAEAESQIVEESIESQILEESEDTAETFTFGGLSMILPTGFSVIESGGLTLAVYEDYPTHSDNISFTEGEESIDDYTEDNLKAMYESLLESLENYRYVRTDGADYSTIITDIDYVYSNIPMHARNCSYFFSGKIVSITFTSVTGEFDEAFAETQQTIQLA